MEVRVELVGGDALGDDVDQHGQLVFGSRLGVVFDACHVEHLRDDPQGAADHLELVDRGLFLRELVESADSIQPQSLVM